MVSKRRVAYIGLGSNLGDKRRNIRCALRLLGDVSGVKLGAVSRLRRSKPEGYAAQPDFFNGAVRIETSLAPRELLGRLKGIEAELGRRKTSRNGPRLIDLDLLLYSRVVTRGKSLILPHPRLHLRGFALQPLAEIAPGAVHPVLRKRIGTLWRELKARGDA